MLCSKSKAKFLRLGFRAKNYTRLFETGMTSVKFLDSNGTVSVTTVKPSHMGVKLHLYLIWRESRHS